MVHDTPILQYAIAPGIIIAGYILSALASAYSAYKSGKNKAGGGGGGIQPMLSPPPRKPTPTAPPLATSTTDMSPGASYLSNEYGNDNLQRLLALLENRNMPKQYM